MAKAPRANENDIFENPIPDKKRVRRPAYAGNEMLSNKERDALTARKPGNQIKERLIVKTFERTQDGAIKRR